MQVMYNRAAQFWHALYTMFSQYKLIRGREWMHFFGSQQRFFRQMLMAAKVEFSYLCSCYLLFQRLPYAAPLAWTALLVLCQNECTLLDLAVAYHLNVWVHF